jgi:DedD protein
MIRLPKLFNRKTEADDLELGSVRGRRTAKNPTPRSFQRIAEAEELALTEDPEQQRARHRLIGAAVLVLIAVVGLPRILDNKPKSLTNDIAVNIVTSLPIPSGDLKLSEKSKIDTASETVSKEVVSEPKVEIKPDAKSGSKAEVKAEIKPAVPAKSSVLGLAAGEEIVSAQTSSKVEDDAAKTPAATSSLSSTGSGKFIIQIGAFASEERAKGWITKLKEQKIPNFVLNKNGTDGTKLYVLRAGPYTDKEAAEAAEKKIKAMGLTPRLVETGKQ